MNILKAEDLSKVYQVKQNKNTVLKSVSFSIEKGEFVSVMGPSGSGKSTLLYNVSGMDRMSGGSVVFNDKKIESLSEKELAAMRLGEMGFIFQQIHLLKNLSILDNILVPAYQKHTESRKDINRKAEELMERAGIASLADHDITQASGGQLQRAAVCRALINNPDIIFGDEPTGALNSSSAAEIMDLLSEINRDGTTVMLVTHDVKVASRSSRVLFMKDGRIMGEHINNGDNGREERLSGWLTQQGF